MHGYCAGRQEGRKAGRPLINSVYINYQSAKARCYRGVGSAVLHVEYSGVLTTAALVSLGPQIARLASNDPVVIDWHRSVTVWPDPLNLHRIAHAKGSGVFIVRPDQQKAALKHCELLAKLGSLRTVFLQHQAELARAWAECQSTIQRSHALVCVAEPRG